jgi:dihydrofolate synthase/folylpolyglutamate synthase
MDLPSPGQPPSPEIDALYGLRRGATRLGLASTRRLLERLGHPERGVPMLHVAGTNGKGSTTALAAAMLQAGGLRVGRFVSPHVLGVEERIAVDGTAIDPDTFRRYVRSLWPHIERSGASFFEAMTAIAAVHFRDRGVQAAVYEVGLGGRLDSTNALPSTVAMLTSVGHDHEAILGRGLRAVAREKLGIAKHGVPFFAALDRPDLVRLARDTCRRRRAPLVLVPPDAARVVSMGLESGSQVELRLPVACRLSTRFLGVHQGRNVALAAFGSLELWRRGAIPRPPDLATGAARAFLPGRFQVLPQSAGESTVVLDVGHNPEALSATLDLVEALLPGERPAVVLGLLRDKKMGEAAARLGRRASLVLLVAPGVLRAWDPRRAAALFPRGRGLARIEVAPQVGAALARACESGRTVLVLGSHYLLGEALPVLAARRGTTAALLLSAPLDAALRVAV